MITEGDLSALGIVCPRVHLMMVLQYLSAGRGVNRRGESGLDDERFLSLGSEHPQFTLPPPACLPTLTTSHVPSALALSHSGLASPSPESGSCLSLALGLVWRFDSLAR